MSRGNRLCAYTFSLRAHSTRLLYVCCMRHASNTATRARARAREEEGENLREGFPFCVEFSVACCTSYQWYAINGLDRWGYLRLFSDVSTVGVAAVGEVDRLRTQEREVMILGQVFSFSDGLRGGDERVCFLDGCPSSKAIGKRFVPVVRIVDRMTNCTMSRDATRLLRTINNALTGVFRSSPRSLGVS